MVEKLESYRCSVCKGIFVGSYENALRHEQIPIDPPLPTGLVLRTPPSDWDTYCVINDYGKMNQGGLIGSPSHDYRHEVVTFYVREKRLIEHGSHEKSSLLIKKRLRNKSFSLLHESDFSYFVSLYDQCPRVHTVNLASSLLVRTNEELEHIAREAVTQK